MTDTQIIASLPLPPVNTSRIIWQPVTDSDGIMMRPAPLDWQPSGAHHAIAYLLQENDALRAALDAAQAKPVGVKLLHWEHHPMGWIADPPTGQAYIIDVRIKGRVMFIKGLNPPPKFDNIDAAKAAAQADYEARIRSALTTPDTISLSPNIVDDKMQPQPDIIGAAWMREQAVKQCFLLEVEHISYDLKSGNFPTRSPRHEFIAEMIRAIPLPSDPLTAAMALPEIKAVVEAANRASRWKNSGDVVIKLKHALAALPKGVE